MTERVNWKKRVMGTNIRVRPKKTGSYSEKRRSSEKNRNPKLLVMKLAKSFVAHVRQFVTFIVLLRLNSAVRSMKKTYKFLVCSTLIAVENHLGGIVLAMVVISFFPQMYLME